MEDSQDTQETGQEEQQKTEGQLEPSIDDFIAEFNPLTTEKLKEYEVKNRQRLIEAPYEVLAKFAQKWKKNIGGAYFTGQGSRTLPISQERTDPKSKGYRGYWEVIFQPKGRPDDPDDVNLVHNGECLQMQRDIPVILPGPFLEVADHGVYPTYIQMPGQSRKIGGYVKFFPYTVLREATKEEYFAMKAEGDKATAEARQREEMVA